jgi:hypothetical protein
MGYEILRQRGGFIKTQLAGLPKGGDHGGDHRAKGCLRVKLHGYRTYQATLHSRALRPGNA